VQLWRRGVGPGWSSFAVRGDRIYTQEQRGADEVVSSYRLSTGAPIWRHRDHVRFWESNAGAGPRATPTLRDGRVYAFGATGILNSLDEATGAVIWSRDVSADTKVKVPMWGFASSPLVVGDLVIIAASGKLAGYDLVSGTPKWVAPSVGGSYSSPQLATVDGVEQVVLMGGSGAAAFAPDTGARLWESSWPSSVTIVQPAIVGDRDIVITTAASTGGEGIRRLEIARPSGKWVATERWTSNGLKPYFNDYVVHKGYAYGFDGSILSCVDLADGTRKWKGGRYGNGQLMLLPDQDLLLVTSEEGYLALVKASPDQFTEVSRFTGALEGKTWNHPVLVRDVLLVRNDHEMAAFRLPAASGGTR
jgi:outer membrane protein assembly factor BamB